MRSSELAALAGVTVRTLRHYHQIGLLEEPERSVNGYRDYDVRHLVRILRISRLTGLGVPLAALPDVLDDQVAADELLDELDQQAAAEIERLTSRRAVIAGLRRHGALPDLPPALASYGASLSATADIAPDLARHEREQMVLLAHLVGEQGTTALAGFLGRASALTPGATALLRRFAELGPDTPERDVEQLAEDFAEHYRPVLEALPDIEVGADALPLLAAYSEQTLNDQQRRANRLLQDRITSWHG
ncbi:MerR family transcriptional regulator [Prauserella cavernicola]|uniref:MerR family DNA-binding transcriptional regulator n=1 Tax=Prauserella cavernicola TaxID=2800127 RepID=A0A934V1S3_9PSEU|nr:MerR family transcriptional regulator [Prauserella cavernicola]MBK1783806.1 MerR family DNA-binding transcriptional regulator [Prauserella cavernicola]